MFAMLVSAAVGRPLGQQWRQCSEWVTWELSPVSRPDTADRVRAGEERPTRGECLIAYMTAWNLNSPVESCHLAITTNKLDFNYVALCNIFDFSYAAFKLVSTILF